MWMRSTQWAPRVADALGGIYVNGKKPVVDIDDGIDSTTSGPAVVFTVNPERAAKAGFTTDQLTTVASAIVDGEPATTPVIINDRPYTVRVRYPKRSAGVARSHEQHAARELDRRDGDAGGAVPTSPNCRARPKSCATTCSATWK